MELGDAATWAAALIATGAAVWSWRSATAANRSAVADEQMLHHQRTPQFTALVEDMNGDSTGHGGTPRLMLQLVSPQAVDSVEVELVTPETVFPPSQNGVEPGAPRRIAVRTDGAGTPVPMAVGQEARWRIAFPAVDAGPKAIPPVDVVQLVVHAAKGKARWDVLVKAPVEARQKYQGASEQFKKLNRYLTGKQ
ncbi:hypothetical protein [Micromonospora sp. NBC_00617]|uniref:hypothetical protein n=1 Tax=Micromonospora sp. NBC_00617 TaxID=2903587 RepID=UPI0030E4BC30